MWSGENRSAAVLIGIAIVAVAVFIVVDPEKGPLGDTSITGRLDSMAAAGDDPGLRLMLHTTDDVYQVADDELGRKLLSFPNRWLKVRGRITINRSGQKVLHVKNFSVLQ